MGIFSYVKAGKKIFDTIKSVKPAVGKSKLQKAVDSAKLEGRKLKGKTKKFIQKMEQDIDPARIKLRQTTQKLKGEKVTESGISKGKDLRENKMGGGMMGRRFGYKSGMSVKGDNKRDIRKTESMIGASKSSKREKGLIGRQSVIAKQAGDPKKIESVDFKVLQAKRKNKKKVV